MTAKDRDSIAERIASNPGMPLAAAAVLVAGFSPFSPIRAGVDRAKQGVSWLRRVGGTVGGAPAAPTPPADADPPAAPPTPAPDLATFATRADVARLVRESIAKDNEAEQAAAAAARPITAAEVAAHERDIIALSPYRDTVGKAGGFGWRPPMDHAGIARVLNDGGDGVGVPGVGAWLGPQTGQVRALLRDAAPGLGLAPPGTPEWFFHAPSPAAPPAPASPMFTPPSPEPAAPPVAGNDGKPGLFDRAKDWDWGTVPGTRIPIPTTPKVTTGIGFGVGEAIKRAPGVAFDAFAKGTQGVLGAGVGLVESFTGASAAEKAKHDKDLSDAFDYIITGKETPEYTSGKKRLQSWGNPRKWGEDGKWFG